MTNKFFICFFILIQIKHSVFCQSSIQKEVDEIINSKEIKSASIGIYAIDLATNKMIVEVNANKSFCPASVLKISTTMAALEFLGEDFTFKTSFGYSGRLIGNELIGDFFALGKGDPTFGSKYFKNKPELIFQSILQELKTSGIKKITGKIIVDDGHFDYQPISPKWIYEDFGNYYGAGTYGLNWRDNSYSLFLNSTEKNISIDKITPTIEGLTFNNQLKTADNKKDNAFIFGEPYGYDKKITGTIPMAQKSFEIKGAIPDPALQFADELKIYLRKNGIDVSGKSTTTRLIKLNDGEYKIPTISNILKITSPPLKEIIIHTNMNSDNMYAESLIKYMDIISESSKTLKGGIGRIMDFWKLKKVNTDEIFFEDGSGLSRFNMVSPSSIVSMLQVEFVSKNKKIFMESLPVAGISGGMKNIGVNTIAQNNIFAKTGYMTRVRSYAGYMNTKGKNQIAFSIILNNYSCTDAEAKKVCEKIMLAIVNY